MKVIQCWDDGVIADIRLCDILRKHSAKATFNLNAGLHEKKRSNGWLYHDALVERLAQNELSSVYDGFTIANHSFTHPDLCSLTQTELEHQILDNQKTLQNWFNQPITGFAYPFGTWNEQTIDVLKKSGHLYARSTINKNPCFPPENELLFHPTCHFLDEYFWDYFEAAKATEVFYFWGHSYELTNEGMWRSFEEKIKTITEDEQCQWAEISSLFE